MQGIEGRNFLEEKQMWFIVSLMMAWIPFCWYEGEDNERCAALSTIWGGQKVLLKKTLEMADYVFCPRKK
jgi:hypothetical protein